MYAVLTYYIRLTTTIDISDLSPKICIFFQINGFNTGMKTAELCNGNIKMKADHKDVNFLSLLLRLRRSNNTETPYPFSGKRASKTVSSCFEFSVVERSNHSFQSEQTRTTQSPRSKNAVEFRKWRPPESNVNFETLPIIPERTPPRPAPPLEVTASESHGKSFGAGRRTSDSLSIRCLPDERTPWSLTEKKKLSPFAQCRWHSLVFITMQECRKINKKVL